MVTGTTVESWATCVDAFGTIVYLPDVHAHVGYEPLTQWIPLPVARLQRPKAYILT